MITQVFALAIFVGVAVIAGPAAPQFRVIGGHEAKPHEFPFMVSLCLSTPEDSHFSNCGGTILSNQWILTAAHCLYAPESKGYRILAGKHDLSVEESGQEVRKPGEFFIHPNFNINEMGLNDIGLIHLDEPLKFSDTVKPVALPQKDSIPKGSGKVIGWGSTSKGYTPNFPNRLQTAEVPILDFKTCSTALYDVTFYDSNICSGPLSGGIGHCSGDSGGPFVQDDNGITTLIGVVSWGYEPCGGEDAPPVFVRVSHFLDWIKDTMNRNK